MEIYRDAMSVIYGLIRGHVDKHILCSVIRTTNLIQPNGLFREAHLRQDLQVYPMDSKYTQKTLIYVVPTSRDNHHCQTDVNK